MSDEKRTVEVPVSLVNDLADNHKEVARFGYRKNRTAMADRHHSWARQLNDATDRAWDEVAADE